MTTPKIDTRFDKKNQPVSGGIVPVASGVAALNGSMIQYVAPVSVKNAAGQTVWALYICTADAAKYQTSGNSVDLQAFDCKAASGFFTSTVSDIFYMRQNTQLSIVPVGSYNYIFWQSDSGEFWALRCRPDRMDRAEISKIDLYNTDLYYNSFDKSIAGCFFGLSAFPLQHILPEYSNAIGCVAQTATIINGSWNYQGSHYQYLLDPDKFRADELWPVRRLSNWSSIILPVKIDNDFYDHCATTAGVVDYGATSSQISGNPSVSVATRPNAYLILATQGNLSRSTSQFRNSFFHVDLSRVFPPIVSKPAGPINPDPFPAPGDAANDATLAITTKTTNGVNLISAPDGKLYGYYCQGGKVQYALLRLNTTGSAQIIDKPQWEFANGTGLYTDPDGTAAAMTASFAPPAVFIPMQSKRGNSPCPVPVAVSGGQAMSGDRPSQVYPDCLLQDHVQFIVGNATSGTKYFSFSTFYWGTVFCISDYIVAKTVPGSSGTVSMIADTFPYPVPNPSFWSFADESPSGMVNWGVCTYEYLVDNGRSTSVASEITSASGFQLESEVLVAAPLVPIMIGARNEYSSLNGITRLMEQSSDVRNSTGLSVETKATPITGPLPEGSLAIDRYSAFFANTAPSELHTAYYLLRLRGQAQIANTLAMTVRPFVSPADYPVPRSGDFEAYCYAPGNLLSYEKDAIDARMKQNFERAQANYNAANPGGKPFTDQFNVFGEKCAGFYTGGDYIDKIVERFGVSCFGPDGNLPYLEFTFSLHGTRRNAYQTTSSFTHGGGSFVNTSNYAGIGWGTDVSVSAGAFVTVSAPILHIEGYAIWGMEYSSSYTQTETTSESWGIGIGEYLNPLAPGEAYTVRLYLLKPSPLWARELEWFGYMDETVSKPTDIDYEFSSPSRILFTVSYISEPLRKRLAETFPTSVGPAAA